MDIFANIAIETIASCPPGHFSPSNSLPLSPQLVCLLRLLDACLLACLLVAPTKFGQKIESRRQSAALSLQAGEQLFSRPQVAGAAAKIKCSKLAHCVTLLLPRAAAASAAAAPAAQQRQQQQKQRQSPRPASQSIAHQATTTIISLTHSPA